MSAHQHAGNAKPPPQLPLGTISTLRSITESFTFHSSPESFIASRIQQYQSNTDPAVLEKRTPIRARILNRNVAILSSYGQIAEVLGMGGDRKSRVEVSDVDGGSGEEMPNVIASKAYDDLMREFFPPPNLLLADGCPHRRMRGVWDERMKNLCASVSSDSSSASKGPSAVSKKILDILSSSLDDHTGSKDSIIPLNTQIDLYETMKTLSWRILLGLFLCLSPSDELFYQIQDLHEILLRGQFSLLPLSINMGFWRSPRTKGIEARKKLQGLVVERMEEMCGNGKGLPFMSHDGGPMEEVRDHVLMMTSSLAVKGMASLLTAFLLNLFLFERGGAKLVDELRSMSGDDQTEQKKKYMKSIYLETERLSPPIVGIMRRVTREMVVTRADDEADMLLPTGWDVWMYFMGGGRDPAVFGQTCNTFDPTRYMIDGVPEPLGFGAGPKSCLGKDLVQNIALLTAEHCLTNKMNMDGDILSSGLKGWLGWEDATPGQWAADMKQLPTQHPKAPVKVKFVKQ